MCMVELSDDSAVVLHDRDQVARTQHVCGECKRTIDVGETYKVERLVSEGRASTHKTCRHCVRVREWLARECGGWIYGGVADDIWEHDSEGDYGIHVKMMAAGIWRQWKRRDGRMWRLPRVALKAEQA